MNTNPLPKIIQGGMGIGVSGWKLAKAVSECGQLGVVAGTSLDVVMIRRLQNGDQGGHVRRALDKFPFNDITERIIDSYYLSGGKDAKKPYKPIVMSTVEGPRIARENIIAANFVEIYLAKEGHDGIVGVNYLEKVTLPVLPSIYGAMLADVDYVIIGAGIPKEVPAILEAYTEHKPASYPIRISGEKGNNNVRMQFDPADYISDTEVTGLKHPIFLPIISSAVLAAMLLKRSNGKIDGFVIEEQSAGGHNAPPRGAMRLTDDGQPIYGNRDVVDLETIRQLGLPFWLAGSYGSTEGLKKALDSGAAGIQVGTAFAFCTESGLTEKIKEAVIDKALSGNINIHTSAKVSPTGFPFKVADLEGTLSKETIYNKRTRVCDLGYLREPYYKDNGSIGYRCSAESETAFYDKGGKTEGMGGKVCICNALAASIGIAQVDKYGVAEPPIVTCGNDIVNIEYFVKKGDGAYAYSAADVIKTLLGE